MIIEKHDFVNRMTVILILMLQDNLKEGKQDSWHFVEESLKVISSGRETILSKFKEGT